MKKKYSRSIRVTGLFLAAIACFSVVGWGTLHSRSLAGASADCGSAANAPATQSAAPATKQGPVRLTHPKEGDVLNDTATFTADIDPAEKMNIGKVSFYIEEQLMGDACPGKPQVSWNTQNFSDGDNFEVSVRVYSFDQKTHTIGPEKARHSAHVKIHNHKGH